MRGAGAGDLYVLAQGLCELGLGWPGPPRWRLPRPVRAGVVLLTGMGGGLALAGAAELGRQARLHLAPPDKSELRTGGAYAFLRHPIYTGILGGCRRRGAPRPPQALLAAAALAAVLASKATCEERLLTERFGLAYEDYCERVPRRLPRLGRAQHGLRARRAPSG